MYFSSKLLNSVNGGPVEVDRDLCNGSGCHQCKWRRKHLPTGLTGGLIGETQQFAADIRAWPTTVNHPLA
jgi:hypothetical protein